MHNCCGSNDLYFVGFYGGSINIAHLDEKLAEGIIKDKILAVVDEHSQRIGHITQRGGEWGNVSVSASFVFLPTNEAIYGVSFGRVPPEE